MNATYTELRERLAEITDLERASALLGWDQQVKMPPGGAGVRAEQLASLQRIAHEALVSDDMGRLLDELAAYEESLEHDSDEASLIRRRPARLGEGEARPGRARRPRCRAPHRSRCRCG